MVLEKKKGEPEVSNRLGAGIMCLEKNQLSHEKELREKSGAL